MARKTTKSAESATVPALVVTPEKAPVVDGNFSQVEAFLLTWKQQVSSIELTEENITQVRIVKKEAQELRNKLTKIQTDVKKLYFNGPKATFDAKMDHLLSVVADVEGSADKVLDLEEQRRRDALNEVLDVYKDTFQGKYKLEAEYLERVEYKKEYYNKTANEKDSKDDLEQQFVALKKEQDARAASLRLIKTMCKDEPRLNVQHWIDQLAFKDIAIVTEEITAEKERLLELDKSSPAEETTAGDEGTPNSEAEEETPATAEETKKLVLGVPSTIDFSSDFPDRFKFRDIRLKYPCDLGDAVKELFQKLKPYGITQKEIQKEEVAF